MSQRLWNQMFADGASLIVARAHGTQVVALRPSGSPVLGSLVNAATGVATPLGSQDGEALNFNGVQQYATVPTSGLIDITADWSCFFCFRIDSDTQDEHELLRFGNTTNGLKIIAEDMHISGSHLRSRMALSGAALNRQTSTSVVDLEPHRVYTVGLARISGSGITRFWINGALANGAANGSAIDTAQSGTLHIGVSNTTTGPFATATIWNLAFFPNQDHDTSGRFTLYDQMVRAGD